MCTQRAQYECSTCGEQFNLKSRLKSHAETHLSLSEVHIWCLTKNAEWDYQFQFDTQRKIFACSKCDVKFTKRDHLKTHEQLHLPMNQVAYKNEEGVYVQLLKYVFFLHILEKEIEMYRMQRSFYIAQSPPNS